MDNQTLGLRSRSRSKTPFLRSSCDHESCTETEEHTHKSGRKTPIIRSTPIKQVGQATKITETITETTEEYSSAPAHRTRASTKAESQDISPEGSDRLRGHGKEIIQNEINNQYERVSTSSQQYSALDDVTFSPIQTSYNLSHDRSRRFGSPATSICSTDSSFAEQALANTSILLHVNPNSDHLPSRLYKMAGEYWNKYPKTDYTYSHMSKDRVELAPGQVAMPNMSRRSLTQFRVQGPNTSEDEVDRLAATSAWTSTTLRKRYSALDSSDDESSYPAKYQPAQRWWITQLIISFITSITTAASSAYRRVAGPSHRYPYTDRRPAQASLVSRTASVAAAPFYWIYSAIRTIVTTTVTTITETITPNHVAQETYVGRPPVAKRRWWPWLLLLLLPAVGYGSHYTYENWEHLAVPNFTDFHLDLKEFANNMPIPNLTLADLNILPKMNLTLPEINITLPDIRENLPEVRKTYNEYKDIVQNRMVDASEYMKVVAESCFEEMRRFWRGYNYADQIKLPEDPEKPITIDTYQAPIITQNQDLTKRMAALEDWAVNVDNRLKFFNQKLSKIDNIEAQIEQYSLKYLQQNLIQIFNTENTEQLAGKLKGYFDKHYMTSEQLQTLSREVHERLISTWKPDMDEDGIRRLIQEYMAVFERKQMEVIMERLKEYVREIEVHSHSHTESGTDLEAVKRIVAGMLNVYDADKTGLVDYALESAGGQVISTKCTELYQIKTKQYSILGLPVWWVYTSPRYALTPGAMPAECWAFQGFPGYLVVRTYVIIEVTGFSVEHMSRLLAVEGKIESAPKNFSVYGLHGEQDPEPHLFGDYMYEANGTAIQYFPVKYPKTTLIGGVEYPVAYDIIELRVESNHGNPTYTCVYRFRVHGNPLSDIRQATEDSIMDSEM